MKKFNKGMVITSTIAAALAAITLAGCGNTAKAANAQTAKPVQTTAVTAAAENAVKASGFTAENKTGNKAETETATVTCKQSYNTKADEVGTAGSNYCESERKWEATGELYEVTGKRIKIEINESDMGEGLYDVVVTASGSAFDSEVYGFLAQYDSETDSLVYDRGAKSCVAYDRDGNMTENNIIDEGHSGTVTYTGAAGIRWTDSDGSEYVFMHDITFA